MERGLHVADDAGPLATQGPHEEPVESDSDYGKDAKRDPEEQRERCRNQVVREDEEEYTTSGLDTIRFRRQRERGLQPAPDRGWREHPCEVCNNEERGQDDEVRANRWLGQKRRQAGSGEQVDWHLLRGRFPVCRNLFVLSYLHPVPTPVVSFIPCLAAIVYRTTSRKIPENNILAMEFRRRRVPRKRHQVRFEEISTKLKWLCNFQNGTRRIADPCGGTRYINGVFSLLASSLMCGQLLTNWRIKSQRERFFPPRKNAPTLYLLID